MNNEELKSNLLSGRHWLRLVFMVLFAILLQAASFIMWVVVLLQFLFSLFTGQDNTNLRQFGHSLSIYIYRSLKFLTYASEEKPFPFSDWPSAEEEMSASKIILAEEVVTEKKSARATRAKPVEKKDVDSNNDLAD